MIPFCRNSAIVRSGISGPHQTQSGSKYPTQLSPILIDLDGDGVPVSSAESGVVFDIFAGGVPVLVAWPDSSADAFLALDRDGSGTIDSGAELFGNRTPLRSGDIAMNGFEALAELDANGDGVVNSDDSGYASLLIWRDDDRNGWSAPSELIGLAAAGVLEISVQAKESRRRDRWGNLFLLRSWVNINGGRSFAYDVFLTWAAGGSVSASVVPCTR